MADAGSIPALESEAQRRRLLAVTKRRATLILAAVAVVFAAVTAAGAHGAMGYVQAAAEASLVGGLADWFAVTALFRRPLGLPIPHTAIVSERKDQFARTLGSFIQEHFLTPEAIVERIRQAGVVSRVAAWAADPAHAERLAAQLAGGAVGVVDFLHDDEIRDQLAELFRQRAEGISLAPLAGRALRRATADGRHDKVLDAGLEALDRYLDVHRDELRARLAGQSPWWLPGAVEDRIFERLLEGARSVLADMVRDHHHHLREELEQRIERLSRDLETSDELRARAEQLKSEVLSQEQLRDWATALWSEAKDELRRQAAEPDSTLRVRIASGIAAFGRRVGEDDALRALLEDRLESAVCTAAGQFHGEVADLITSTIARWDAEETSNRLELLLGPDLQYIRINGTVVGGLAGLVLYTLARLLA